MENNKNFELNCHQPQHINWIKINTTDEIDAYHKYLIDNSTEENFIFDDEEVLNIVNNLMSLINHFRYIYNNILNILNDREFFTCIKLYNKYIDLANYTLNILKKEYNINSENVTNYNNSFKLSDNRVNEYFQFPRF